MSRKIQTVRSRGSLDAVVSVPGSKSITNRALLLAALGDGRTILENALDSEDTQIMLSALRQLGLEISRDPVNRRVIVEGGEGSFPNKNADLDVGNSGTTVRFLAAALCFSGGRYRLQGKPRMHRRPIRDLVDALRQLGADIRCENDDDCPPLLIKPADFNRLNKNRTATVEGDVSSQYLSALLMSSPTVAEQTEWNRTKQRDVEIRLSGPLVSRPYIDMTLHMMRSFGVSTDVSSDFSRFRVAEQKYRSPGVYGIEPDASAASYFFAAAAVCGGRVTLPGLSKDCMQGDIHFVDCLEKMGCDVRFDETSITVSRDPATPLRGISVDMNSISDTAQTLAAVALFADEATEINNIEHVRFKETDRIGDLATELRKFGAEVEERRDGLTVTPPKCLGEALVPATVETYDDHRMAMSFAVVGLRLPGIVILDPDCCRKTFPTFFDELENLA